MGRALKFRAWYPKEARWFPPNSVSLALDGSAIRTLDNWAWKPDAVVLEQFTGLLDSKGVEIFEGDYIRCKPDESPMLVGWNDEMASFALRKKGWMFDHFFKEAVDPQDVEVCGNVHQTPSLLEENRK